MNKKHTLTKPAPLSIAFLAFVLGCGMGYFISPPLVVDPPQIISQPGEMRACFSPEGNCTHQIVTAIEKAQSSILVQSYSFTSPEIAEALAKAHRKEVKVRVLMDKSQPKDRHSQIAFLAQSGIPILIDSPPGIAHNKVMILDERYVLTGSFNFTRAAESRNAENVLLIDSPELAHLYTQNWQRRADKARPFTLWK